MGIDITNNAHRNSQLNQRISADLRQRTQTMANVEPEDISDDVEVEGTKKTGKFTWVWIVLIILAIISLLCILFI